MQEMRVLSLSWEDPLEKETVTHSSILAWEILWMEKSGRLQARGRKSRTPLSDKPPPLYKEVVVYYSVYSSLHLLTSNSPVLPYPDPSLPWQPKVSSLCESVCVL